MPQGPRRWHNVTKNETTRIPKRHIFIDTESRIEQTENGHIQTWRLGCAEFATINKAGKVTLRAADYQTPETLWDDVGTFANREGRTIVWAHNLGYDVRISQALRILPTLGWRLVAHNITSRATWLEWRRERSTLVMADSVSVWNTTLAKVGVWFGLGKKQLSLYDAGDAEWLDRCRGDVQILRTSILAYLAWIKDADMGNWQITGAGQSWATFRHKFMTFKLTVHDEDEVLRVERRAMWAGRCEAYWKGEINAQTVHEWDFSNAYATIARDYPVPVRYLGPMPRGYNWNAILRSQASTFLARVRVKTTVPVVPSERDGRILWPVGEFETTLWAPEIAALLDAGGTVEVVEGWIYRTRPALREWGEWILSQLSAPDDVVPAWQKAILKHHSRALIGRMAMTYREWETFGEAPDSRVRVSKMFDMETNEEYDMMQVGNAVWIDNGRVEWAQSMPMVTGFIQSIARVKLWNVMQALPERVLLYVDTDSLLVTQQHLGVVDSIAHSNAGQGLRLKRSWDGFAIYGPRQITTGHQVRVSGVPRGANHVARGQYDGEVWDSLATTLRGGNVGRVVTRNRTWNLKGVDYRREGTAPGWTEPITIGGST
jgi:hypothetical protein